MTEGVAFTPANGIESRKTIVLRLLSVADYGDLISYETLSEALDGAEIATVQRAVGSAKMTLERDHQKSVMAVAMQGYRVVQPNEHLAIAVGHQRKSRRALRRGLSTAQATDLTKLTEGESAAITLAATSLALQVDYMRRNDLRASRHEKSLAAMQEKSVRTEEEIAELRDRLTRLEHDR